MSQHEGTGARATDRRMADRVEPAAGPRGLGRVLFVTRKFPPAVGGMEAHAAGMHDLLGQLSGAVELVAMGRSQRHLVWWLPATLARLGPLLTRRPPDHVVIDDALTFAALQPVLRRARPPVTVMVHGLDLVFDAPGYRRLVRWALPSADRVVANSRSTAELARACGVPRGRVRIVHPPVAPVAATAACERSEAERADDRHHVFRELGVPAHAQLLLTVGRLVRRKGVAWFVAEVLPRLGGDVRYAVVGSGPETEVVRRAAERAGLGEGVLLLGRVSDKRRERLLRGADVFVQPNIAVAGDVEGFGMAVVEAALRGTPVVAARLEGLTDALLEGQAGVLCSAGDADAFAAAVADLLADPDARAERAATWAEAARAGFAPERLRADLLAALEGA